MLYFNHPRYKRGRDLGVRLDWGQKNISMSLKRVLGLIINQPPHIQT